MKNIKYILLMFFALICFMPNMVFALTPTMSTKTTVNVGDSFTVTVNLNATIGAFDTIKVTYDSSKFQYTGGNKLFEEAWWDTTAVTGIRTRTYNFKAISAGTGNIGFSGTGFGDLNANPLGDGSVSRAVTVTTPPTPPPAPAPTQPVNPVPPSSNSTNTDATLKSLKISEEGLSPNFKSLILNYSLSIGPKVENISITAVPNDSKATVYVTGNAGLINGDNKIFITVTAADKKTKKTYTITATKGTDPDKSNSYLENLIIDNAKLVEEFISEDLEYTCENIPFNIERLEIRAFPKIKEAKIEIIGNETLVEGENIIKVKVISVDGNVIKEYIIRVIKDAKETEDVRIYSEKDNLEDDSESRWKSIKRLILAYIKEFWLVLSLLLVCLLELIQIIFLYKKTKKVDKTESKVVKDYPFESERPKRRGYILENVENTNEIKEEKVSNLEEIIEDNSDELVDMDEEITEEDIADNFEDTIDEEEDK